MTDRAPHSSPATTDANALQELVSAYGVASFDYGQAKMEGHQIDRCRNERAIRRTTLDNALAALLDLCAALQRERDAILPVIEAARRFVRFPAVYGNFATLSEALYKLDESSRPSATTDKA